MAMTDRLEALRWAKRVLTDRRFVAALALVTIGSAVFTHPIRLLIGWGGLIGVLGTLVLLAAASLVARIEEIDWLGAVPLSVFAVTAWCLVTAVWSELSWITLSASLYQLAYAVLAIFIAIARDIIQTVRDLSKVLRLALTLSFAVEVFAGLLIDMPIPFLKLAGNLPEGGPLQGVFGSSLLFGVVGLIGLVSFGVEFATRSASRGVTVYSVALALLAVLACGSVAVLLTALVTAVAAIVLLVLRRIPSGLRRIWQATVATAVVIAGVILIALRDRVLALLSRSGDGSATHEGLWQAMLLLAQRTPIEGWGFTGYWTSELRQMLGSISYAALLQGTGLSAWFDMLLQTGAVGLLAFAVLLVLAFTRNWLLASRRRSPLYLAPALWLTILIAISFFSSLAIVDLGWFLVVMCAVMAAQRLSWRSALGAASPHDQLRDGGQAG